MTRAGSPSRAVVTGAIVITLASVRGSAGCARGGRRSPCASRAPVSATDSGLRRTHTDKARAASMSRNAASLSGKRLTIGYRAGGTRTPNPRFWRPVLCQLSYCPRLSGLYGGRCRARATLGFCGGWAARPDAEAIDLSRRQLLARAGAVGAAVALSGVLPRGTSAGSTGLLRAHVRRGRGPHGVRRQADTERSPRPRRRRRAVRRSSRRPAGTRPRRSGRSLAHRGSPRAELVLDRCLSGPDESRPLRRAG
jgi:hypothetical protein